MNKISVIIAGLILLASCDFLNQKPQSSITQETIELNEQTLESMCNALYKDWWGENYGFNCRMASLSLAADDVTTGNYGTTRLPLDDQMRVPVDNKDVEILWAEFYKVIHSANNIISLINANTRLDKGLAGPFLGEAHFMRALMYFYIVRLWGDAPATVDPNSAKDINGDETMPRVSVGDIYTKIIIPDAQMAETLLGDKSRDAVGQAPTRWAAKALLADVYLTMAGWPLKKSECYGLAADKAWDVIKNSGHSLVSDYKTLWLKAESSDKTEHIFSLHHTLQYLPSQYAISYMGTEETGWADYVADPVFFASFPDDSRKEFCYVTQTVDKSGNTIRWQDFATKSPYIRKYRNYGGCGKWGIEGETSTSSSLSEGLTSIYRFADILLIFAEASNKAAGQPGADAYDCLNRVRERAFGNDAHNIYSLSSEDFDKAVFDEYGWETVFEFKRWFQLVRKEKVDEMLSKNPDIQARVNVSKQNYLFPVPARQVDLRKWRNNPGY